MVFKGLGFLLAALSILAYYLILSLFLPSSTHISKMAATVSGDHTQTCHLHFLAFLSHRETFPWNLSLFRLPLHFIYEKWATSSFFKPITLKEKRITWLSGANQYPSPFGHMLKEWTVEQNPGRLSWKGECWVGVWVMPSIKDSVCYTEDCTTKGAYGIFSLRWGTNSSAERWQRLGHLGGLVT